MSSPRDDDTGPSPAELGAELARQLAHALPAETLRPLEPEPAYSALSTHSENDGETR